VADATLARTMERPLPGSVPTNEPEAHKRRSARIVQAVPLTVSGVDALGRPFQERTSTLIINCHGCRYQSKHYVLKNMWVTLEVPHPEQGHPPRTVRGRVMWIQRPRTVRELFQVGVELEVSGNFWGIAFPPSDWFPFPEGPAAIPAPAASASIRPVAPPPAAWPTPAHVFAEEKIRTLPLPVEQTPALESSLAPQLAQLIEQAKQDLQACLRQSAAEAVSLEARPLIASLEVQLRGIAEKSLESAAAPIAERALRETREAQVSEFLTEFNNAVSQTAEQALQQIASRAERMERERAAAVEQRIEKRLQEVLEQLQKSAADLHPSGPSVPAPVQAEQAALAPDVQELRASVQDQLERARAGLSEIETAFRQLQDQASAAFKFAQTDWTARIESDLDGAAKRWNEQIESSIQTARQNIEERLAAQMQSAGEAVEKDISARLNALTKNFANTAQDSENRLNALRSSLYQGSERAEESLRNLHAIESRVSAQIDNHSARLNALAEAAENTLAQRATALLEAQSEEMARRAEGAIATWAERLQPALEVTGQQTVTRLAGEIKENLSASVEKAAQVLSRLEHASASAHDWLRQREESLARASEQAVQLAFERVKEFASLISRDLHESGRATIDKWIAEIDARATDTTHHTFESLFKTSEWYEKKIQTQMQAAIDKGLENVLAELKEKAREMSGVFGAELNHYSNSYVEHTRGQVEETAREILERLGKQSEEMAAASAASIVQQAREDSEAALTRFRAKSAELSAEINKQFQVQAAELRMKTEADAQQYSADFRKSLRVQAQDEFANAGKELLARIASAREELVTEAEDQQKKLTEYIAGLNVQAIEDYRRKLEAASNSWLLTTASKLNQQSEQHLQDVAKTAEERLRDACNIVFSDVGEALRRRLVNPEPAPESHEKPGP
jgi:hypothetical protein